MAIELGNLVISFGYVLLCILGNYPMVIIRSYHERKPLGLQSLFSKSVILLVQIMHVTTTYWAFHFSCGELLPLGQITSRILTFIGK